MLITEDSCAGLSSSAIHLRTSAALQTSRPLQQATATGAGQGVNPSPAQTVKGTVGVRFVLDHAKLVSSPYATLAFKRAVAAAAAAGVRVPVEWVTILDMHKGLVVVMVVQVEVPRGTPGLNNSNPDALRAALLRNPDATYAAVKKEFNITTAVTAEVWQPVPQRPGVTAVPASTPASASASASTPARHTHRLPFWVATGGGAAFLLVLLASFVYGCCCCRQASKHHYILGVVGTPTESCMYTGTANEIADTEFLARQAGYEAVPGSPRGTCTLQAPGLRGAASLA